MKYTQCGMYVRFFTRELLEEKTFLENSVALMMQSMVARQSIDDLQLVEDTWCNIHEIEAELMIRM